MKSEGNMVRLEPQHAVALVSSAQWMQSRIRKGDFGAEPNERQVAVTQLQEAIDAATAQLERVRRLEPARPTPWEYIAAITAVCAVTVLIGGSYLLGMPRTVVGLYIPVLAGVAVLVGWGPSLLGSGLAFVLNDVVFVHPGQFSPTPEQIAALGMVVLTCIALHWLKRMAISSSRLVAAIRTHEPPSRF